MKSEQIKHSLSVGIKSIQSRVFDRETDEVISFVKIPIEAEVGYLQEKIQQQQAEIEALKEELDKQGKIIPFTESEIKYSKPQFPDKPVGWWDGNPKNVIGISKTKECEDWIPLYTHPVKDLEDIDINITWNENSMRDFGKDELNSKKKIFCTLYLL